MLKDYLKTSPIAESVELETNVILNRVKLSTDDVIEMKKKGKFSVDLSKRDTYELEVNGLVIAKGRIVKTKGEFYFKVSELAKENIR